MPVPTNPKMSDIITEFGVALSTLFSAFLRGAGIVPNIPQNAAVPTALPMNMSQMVGAIKLAPPDITNRNIDSNVVGGTARAGYRLTASGAAQQRVQNTYTTLENWLPGGSSAANYGVYVTQLSGSALESGTLNSLLQLNADREWVISRGTLGSNTAQLQVQLCSWPDGTVMDTAIINITATRDAA